ALTSMYFLVFVTFALVGSAAARPLEWAGKQAKTVLPLVLLAAGVAVIALMPFLWPYLQARQEQEMFVRTLPEVGRFSAHAGDYLATGGRFHNEMWSGKFFRGDYLFPGITALALALVSIVSGVAFRDPRARMALVFGLISFAMSFGPAFPLYGFLY